MAPEETTGFTSPFFTVSPFAQQAAPTAPVTDDEDAEDEGADEQQSTQPGLSFGLVFQAPDPQQRLPKRERLQPTQRGDDARDDAEQDEDADGDTPRRERSQRSSGNRRQRGEQRSQDGDAAQGDAADDTAKDETANNDTRADSDYDDQAPRRRRRGGRGRRGNKNASDEGESNSSGDSQDDDAKGNGSGRGKQSGGRNAQDQNSKNDQDDQNGHENDEQDAFESGDDGEGGSSKRTRRRRRSGFSNSENDEPGIVTKVREPRKAKDEVTSIKGSTRLEAKRQRRREGREAGRRRTVITEAEFLARRESVERTMVVREQEGRTQIGVLEDGVLAEHYVSRQEQASSMAGNVYLGCVQNVLPSMEAAFVDIGRGRNAVLYAGEVNWDAAGLDNKPKRIEHALKAGESVLVQVTKDPIGHKGARLTSQISLPGRYVVFVPGNSMTGISRKLPDTERSRLKKILKEVVPADAGVIVRTAAEGASEDELRADVERLMGMWEKIQKKAERGHAPSLLHGEPDLTVRVIRDVFNEDFAKMIVEGDHAWDEVHSYISEVAPDLQDRLKKWTGEKDVFAEYRIDEQLAKAMDRKVWLPSGGSLIIDRTEAMTVVDVNTGKFVGSGGNLEETVTKNNIEAAEEIVRQLRLRDIGGMIVIDFIDMVLESNRDLVVRRLLECLGRDRTKHQVAEVTSLGLVQMTRKRVGSGLIEVFSEPCEACEGRGIIVHDHPVENRDINGNETNRKGRGRKGGQNGSQRDNGGSQHQNGSQGSKNDNGSNGSETANERDNRFAEIAAAAHAAAISAGDKSAVSEPVSTGSSDDAVMTASGAVVEPTQDSPAAASTEQKGGRKRTGRVQRPAERAAQQEAESSASTEAAGASESAESSGSSSSPEASVQGDAASAAPAAKAPARKRGSRRAATSSGAPTRTGEAQVMTVPASGSAQGSSAPADQAASHQPETPVEALQAAAADKADGAAATTSTVAPTSAPKRARRRAGTSAGAPVTLQPVDLTSAGSSSAPLTQVASAAAGDTAPERAADASTSSGNEPKAPARRKRARVSAPAGAPAAPEPSEG